MNKIITIPGIAVLILLAGCTSQEVYTGVQTGNKVQCLNEPTNAAYEECMKNSQESYDSYQDKRQENSEIDNSVTRPRSGY
jgi:hypothetical protein